MHRHKIYYDAFKNYLWVKVFDDNVSAIIKKTVFFICLCFNKVSWVLGVKKILGHAQFGIL